jgi:hypothetical protein
VVARPARSTESGLVGVQGPRLKLS